MNFMSLTPEKIEVSRKKLNLLKELMRNDKLEFISIMANTGVFDLDLFQVNEVIEKFFNQEREELEKEDVIKFQLYLFEKYSYLSDELLDTLILFLSNGFLNEGEIISILNKIEIIGVGRRIGMQYEDLFSLLYFDELTFGE